MAEPSDPVGLADSPPGPRGGISSPPPRDWFILLSAALVAIGVVGRPRLPQPDASACDRTQSAETAAGGDTAAPPLPGRSWLDIVLRVFGGISADRILLIAAGVTFYAILAIFPGIAAIISIYGLFADPGSISAHLDAFYGVAPGGAVEILRDQLTRLAKQGRAALGFGFAVSLLFALWSANAGISGLFSALTAVCEERDQRSLLGYYTTTLAFTLAAIVLVLLALAILLALPLALAHLPNPGATPALLLGILRWPVLLVIAALVLSVVYRYGPGCAERRWHWLSWGSGGAAIAWLGVSALFTWYVANFGSYNKTYGSLGAIIGFMTWIWLSMVVVLVGAKLDVEIARGRLVVRRATPDDGLPQG
jgi:membrane protein